ncbi:MAG: hypothetical protein VCC36_07935 [Gammaproteobacteria bacterium]
MKADDAGSGSLTIYTSMDWLTTPLLLVAFSGVVFFAVSCIFCFGFGRLMGKMDGRDAPGQGRRTGAVDRRGPHRGSTPEPSQESPILSHRSTG